MHLICAFQPQEELEEEEVVFEEAPPPKKKRREREVERSLSPGELHISNPEPPREKKSKLFHCFTHVLTLRVLIVRNLHCFLGVNMQAAGNVMFA